jgi:ACS family hexuronate transporter-like MFS transporter
MNILRLFAAWSRRSIHRFVAVLLSTLRLFRDWSRRNVRWSVAILLMLSTLVCYLDRQALAVAGPVLRERFHLSYEDFAFIVNSYLVAYAVMHPISGRIIDWLGTRLGFTLAVTFWSISNMAHAFATGVKSFSAFRFLLGIGEAGNFPGAIKTVSEWFPPKERAVATGIFNIGAGGGAVVAPPLVAWLILRHGWQAAFVVTGATGFLWVLAWILLYDRPDRHRWLTSEESEYIRRGQESAGQAANSGSGTWRETLSRSELWVLMLGRFISDPAWWFYLIWLPNYLSDVRHFSLVDIAMWAWVPYLGADCGSLLGGLLSAFLIRRGLSVLMARKVAMCICAAMMPVAIPAVHANSPYVALLFITIATTAHQAWAASLLTLPADLFPKKAVGSAYGFTGMCGVLGAIAFTFLVGRVVHHFGYTPVFMIVGFLHPMAAILIMLLVRARKEGPPGGFPAVVDQRA